MKKYFLFFICLIITCSINNVYALDCNITLRSGSNSSSVIELQNLLNEKVGCGLDVDGSFGPLTKACVKKYQEKNELDVDGIVGKMTCSSLMGRLEPIIKTYNSSVVKGIVSSSSVNIRESYSTNSRILDTVSYGKVFKILDNINGWYKISYNNNYAYIRSDLMVKNFILVDISDQRLYYFSDGLKKWSTRVVTGMKNVSDTPLGVYVLRKYNLDRDRYLDGYKNGVRIYHSHVDYWMPFNGGVGFHDAYWRDRSEYTKDRYTYDGSHGCVNMQFSAAKKLFNSISSDKVVIVRK